MPFPPPRDLPNPEIEPRTPTSQADSLPSELQGSPIYKRICLLLDYTVRKFLLHAEITRFLVLLFPDSQTLLVFLISHSLVLPNLC